jgi:type 1 fimbria pilin
MKSLHNHHKIKILDFYVVAFLTLICFAFPSVSVAATAQQRMTVTSTMIQNTCHINGISQTGATVAVLSLNLGAVPASSFTTAGKRGNVVSVANNVVLTNCPANISVVFSLDSSLGSWDSVTKAYRNQLTSNAASNIQAEILDAEQGKNTLLIPGGVGVTKTTDSVGTTNFTIGSRFISVGKVTPGLFSTTTWFNITYP